MYYINIDTFLLCTLNRSDIISVKYGCTRAKMKAKCSEISKKRRFPRVIVSKLTTTGILQSFKLTGRNFSKLYLSFSPNSLENKGIKLALWRRNSQREKLIESNI